MDMEKMDNELRPSHLILFKAFFQALPLNLQRVPISEAKRLLRKKPYLVNKFAQNLVKKLNGDSQWVGLDADLHLKQFEQLPAMVFTVPTAKRPLRNWQRAAKRPLSLDRNLLYFQKTLSGLLESSTITPQQETIIRAALNFASGGLGGLLRQLSEVYSVDDVWRLPSGKRMLFSSDLHVKRLEDEGNDIRISLFDRISDPSPYAQSTIKDLMRFHTFDLEREVLTVPRLTRLERQILLLKCHSDVSLEETARELRKPIGSITRTFYSARKKMDSWLQAIGMKEILQINGGRTDQWATWLFNPPRKTMSLPSLWNDAEGSPSPVREWFGTECDQSFLKSLIPPNEEKPWTW